MGSLNIGQGNSGAPYEDDQEKHRRKIADVIFQLLNGKTNNHGTITLTASAGSTAVTFDKAGVNSVVSLSPTTANAAAAVGTTYISAKGKKTFTLSHANNGQTDRIFDFVVTG
jgi:hypothetical protein